MGGYEHACVLAGMFVHVGMGKYVCLYRCGHVCVCVSLKVHIGMCVYPCRFIHVCRNEQVWVGVYMCV